MRLLTEQVPKEIPNCKTWEQTPTHLKQLHTEVLGTTEVTALPFSTQGMSTLSSEILLPAEKDKMKSLRSSTAEV